MSAPREPETIWHVIRAEDGQVLKTVVGNDYDKCLAAAARLLGLSTYQIFLEDSGFKKLCCGKGTVPK